MPDKIYLIKNAAPYSAAFFTYLFYILTAGILYIA